MKSTAAVKTTPIKKSMITTEEASALIKNGARLKHVLSALRH